MQSTERESDQNSSFYPQRYLHHKQPINWVVSWFAYLRSSTSEMKCAGHFPKGIKHMLVEVYEILRSLPKITDVVTNPAY